MLENKYHDVKWPSLTFESPIDAIPHLLKRFNEASDIYQMFSVLCEVMIFSEDSKQVTYLEVSSAFLSPSGHCHLENLSEI